MKKIRSILSNYEADSPGTKDKLARLMLQGKLAGTGKLVILPVDQGFEHGPARSFAMNPAGYDPHYHFQLAIDAGLSAFAAPLGMLETGVDTFAGQLPTILKLNSSTSWTPSKDQAFTGTVSDAMRLGCVGVGLTIYPGSEQSLEMMEEAREIISEAKACGLVAVVWSYPRGGNLDKAAESAFDVTAYAAHQAALLGAHIIKVKPPTDHIAQKEAVDVYEKAGIPKSTLAERIAHVRQACFNAKRIVIFSGGAAKDTDSFLDEIRSIHAGGGSGSIVGRNAFQRPKAEALDLLNQICDIYLGDA